MRFTIKLQLALSFGLLLILIAAAGLFGVTSLASVNDKMKTFADRPFLQVQRVGSMKAQILDNARLINLTLNTSDDAGKAAKRKEFDNGVANFDALIKQYQDVLAENDKNRVQPLVDAWNAYLVETGKAFDMTQLNSQAKADDLVTGPIRLVAKKLQMEMEAIADKAKGTPHEAESLEILAQVRHHFDEVQSLTYLSIVPTSDERAAAIKADYLAASERWNDSAARLTAIADSTLIAPFEAARQEVHTLDEEALRFGDTNSEEKAAALVVGPVADARKKVTEQIEALQAFEGNVARGFLDETAASYERTRMLLIAIVAAALISGLGVAAWMASTISRGLSRALSTANAVAAGDLTQEIVVKGHDEISDLQRAIKSMVDALRNVVMNVASNAGVVSSGSGELSASSEQMSQGATEQASAAEEASASMEEMASSVKQNADNARQTETMAKQSALDAEASGAAVDRAVDAMQIIASKITIVQEIARQTDLLALNAAVEAARAGEHGRGFAVVASEVRKLAERSQTAAQEIGALSAETVKVAREAGSMLSSLVPNIKRTATLVEEITAACREQDVGSTQINQAIQQLDKVTQQNAAASEEVAATAESLSNQATELQDAISFFKLPPGQKKASEKSDATDRHVSQLRTKASAMRRPAASAPDHRTTSFGDASKAGRKGGFALNIGSGEDELDGDFRKAG